MVDKTQKKTVTSPVDVFYDFLLPLEIGCKHINPISRPGLGLEHADVVIENRTNPRISAGTVLTIEFYKAMKLAGREKSITTVQMFHMYTIRSYLFEIYIRMFTKNDILGRSFLWKYIEIRRRFYTSTQREVLRKRDRYG
jgi:hypothetical protein